MKQLAEYNSQIITMYAQGDSVNGIASKLGIPKEHVILMAKMVFGTIDESREAKAPVSSSVSAGGNTSTVDHKEEKVASKPTPKATGEKKQDNATKLAKLVSSRNKETLGALVAKIKNEELKYLDRDKAMLSLKIIFDSSYREKYANVKGMNNWKEVLKSVGKEEAAKDSSKAELQAVERAEKYFATVVKAESDKRHKKVVPAYEKEIA